MNAYPQKLKNKVLKEAFKKNAHIVSIAAKYGISFQAIYRWMAKVLGKGVGHSYAPNRIMALELWLSNKNITGVEIADYLGISRGRVSLFIREYNGG
jgi:uncharacterized protein YjcR